MRHHNTNRKFGRKRDQRKALVTSLAEALILKERILTTEARAKELRGFVEPLVTAAKKPTLATRRLLVARLGNREKLARKLIDTLAPRYESRRGGYTRVTKVFKKSSDARAKALIEFV